jgi:hypothetical protein
LFSNIIHGDFFTGFNDTSGGVAALAAAGVGLQEWLTNLAGGFIKMF